MRIFGSNSEAGDWMLDPFVEKDSERLSKVSPSVAREDLVEARSEMEKCLESGQTYYFGDDTSDSVKSDIKEYAEVIGMSDDMIEQVSSDRVHMSKEAESLKLVEDVTPPQADQLIFDIVPQVPTDPNDFKKNDDWKDAENSKAKTIASRPAEDGIVPIRGGEKYEQDTVKSIRPGENSIDDPNAINSIATSDTKSTLDEIREAQERRKNETVFNIEDWQAEKEANLVDPIVPQDGHRQVESPVAQNHSSNGAWNNSIVTDPESSPMPDMTTGEQIASANAAKRASISRETQSDDWEQMESSVLGKVGDLFTESLEKELKKIDNE